MKKVTRLTERDLSRIVKRVINEQDETKNGLIEMIRGDIDFAQKRDDITSEHLAKSLVQKIQRYLHKMEEKKYRKE
jgi:hypothetical protein